ncbi:MAG: alpha,alpha-trehalose-phosphate synthase (UDP-forming) [Alphaproteobacteria bacterium]
MSRLVVISNRLVEPSAKEKGASGGLATALHAALREYRGIWFGWSGRVVEQDEGHKLSLGEAGGVKLATLDLDHDDYDEYYNGYANRTLCPLFHYRIDLTAYDRAFDEGYHRVNQRFAQTVAPLIEPEDLVWVHDYHLIPVAQELRKAGLRNRMGFFLHIPFPARQLLTTLPKHKQLIEGLFSYDLLGFQTKDHLEAFRDYVIHEAGGQVLDDNRVQCFGKTIEADAFPIGADTADFLSMTKTTDATEMYERMTSSLRGRRLVIGVDRLDYSKGIENRFEAYSKLLERYPEHRKSALMLQIAPPSRTDVQEYQDLRNDLDSIAGRINRAFAEIDWVPLRYVNKGYRRTELAGLFRASRVAFVTPMRDGMNLVAKEFVAAQDPSDPGVLILSRFAGAAAQLKDALIVNPYDQDDMVAALHSALTMPLEKRQALWKSLYDNVEKEDVVQWRDRFVTTLGACAPKAD